MNDRHLPIDISGVSSSDESSLVMILHNVENIMSTKVRVDIQEKKHEFITKANKTTSTLQSTY